MSDLKNTYPNVSTWRKSPAHPLRYRYQKAGKATLFPLGLEPGTPDFDAFYAALTSPAATASVTKLPTASAAQTFRAAWRLVLESEEWADLDPDTRAKSERLAREFMAMPIREGGTNLWGDALCSEMTDDHLETLKRRWGAKTPSKPWHMKTMLKKIFFRARKKKWVQADPTDLVKWKRGGNKGGYFGHKAWPDEVRAQFEARHPIGSQARTAYALALYTSARRGDVAKISWEQLITVEVDGELVEGFAFEQQKQVQSDADMTQFRPLFDELAEALSPLDRSAGGAVLKTMYGQPFSGKSLTGKMAEWTRQAGIEPGYGLHGLRKAHAAILARSGATLQEQKDMLGHTTMQQVSNYARSVNKQMTTAAAAKKLAGKFRVAER